MSADTTSNTPILRQFVSGHLPAPFKLLSFVDYPPSLRGGPHVHDGYQLVYLEQGSFAFSFTDRDPLRLSAGDVGTIAPGMPHVWESMEPCATMALIFGPFAGERYRDLAAFSSDPQLPRAWSVRIHSDSIPQLVSTIREESEQSSPFQATLLAARLTVFLAEVARAAQANGLPSRDLRIPKQIYRSVEYVELHYREPITLEELAEQAHLGVSRFSELFRLHMGMSPIQYAVCLRLTAAENLLVYTDLPISSIAYHLGFQSLHYFSRAFKKHSGLSPSEFRERRNATRIVR